MSERNLYVLVNSDVEMWNTDKFLYDVSCSRN